MKKQLIISTSIDLVRIAPDKIVYIASDGNYSTLVQTDNEVRMLSYQLGQIEKMISTQLGNEGNIFIRIGKSLIINRSTHLSPSARGRGPWRREHRPSGCGGIGMTHLA